MKTPALALAVVALVAGSAAACGSADSSNPAGSSGSTPATASTSPTAASTSAAPTAQQKAAYAKAQADWKAAAQAPLADLNADIQKAADDLQAANDPAYQTAIGQLNDITSLPHDGLSDAQQKQVHADQVALDKFFGTPGLMS